MQARLSTIKGLGVKLPAGLNLIVIRYAREGESFWRRLITLDVINDPDHVEIFPTGDRCAVDGSRNLGDTRQSSEARR
jgi:hypothetical protein